MTYHNLNGQVLGTQGVPIIGDNIVFNIVNSYNLGNTVPLGTQSVVASRKLNNHSTIQIAKDLEPQLKVIYNKPSHDIQRPKTQGVKKELSVENKNGNMTPNKPHKRLKTKYKLRKVSRKPKEEEQENPIKKQIEKPKKPKEVAKEDNKKADIPHSMNRFKGKYAEIIPIQLSNKRKVANSLSKKEEAREDFKRRMEKAKLESLKIRRENYYLMKSEEQPQDKYVDPDEVWKKKEKQREKEEAEKQRKEWRYKLDNRHREMGLEFIKKKPEEVRPKTTEQAVKKPKKIKENNTKRLKKKPKENVEKKPLTEEEKKARQKLVHEQYLASLKKNKEEVLLKELDKQKKFDKLKELDEKVKTELALSAYHNRKRNNKQKKSQDEDEEPNVLQLNRWIKEVNGEEDEELLKEEVIIRPLSAQPKVIVEKEILFDDKEIKSNLEQVQRELTLKKAESIRQEQINNLKAKKLSPTEMFKLQRSADKIKERLNRIEQKKAESKVASKSYKIQELPVRDVQELEINTESLEDNKAEDYEKEDYEREDYEKEDYKRRYHKKGDYSNSPSAHSENNKLLKKQSNGRVGLLVNSKLPGVGNLEEHLQRTRAIYHKDKNKAVINIQKHFRGFLTRKAIKSVLEENNYIYEMNNNPYKERSIFPYQKQLSSADYETLEDELVFEKDPLTMINAFIQKSVNNLKGKMTNEKEIEEEIGTPSKTFKVSEDTKNRGTVKASQSVSASIPEEIESGALIKSSLGRTPKQKITQSAASNIPEEIGEGDIKKSYDSYIKEDIVGKSQRKTIEHKSISEEIEQQSNIEEPKANQSKEKLNRSNEEIIDKFTQVIKDMQAQHKEEMLTIINKLFQHLNNAPKGGEVIRKESEHKASESSIKYEPDFEAESNNFSKKLERSEAFSSVREEIVSERQEETKIRNPKHSEEITEEIGEEQDSSVVKSEPAESIPEDIPTKTKKESGSEDEIMNSAHERFEQIIKRSNLDSVIKARKDNLRKEYEGKLKEWSRKCSTGEIPKANQEKKKTEIENWHKKQLKVLNEEKKDQMTSTLKQVAIMMEKLEKDKEKAKKFRHESPLRNEERSIKIESLSDLPEVNQEIERIRRELPAESPETRRKKIMQKRKEAERLLAEKNKAIEAGVKDKILRLEEEEVERLYRQAEQIDVKQEIESKAKVALELITKKKSTPTKVKPSEYIAEEIESDKEEIKGRTSVTEDIIRESISIKNKSEDSIDEDIVKESLRDSERHKETINEAITPKNIEESIKESIDDPKTSKQLFTTKNDVSKEESKQDHNYSMKFDEESHQESKRGVVRTLSKKASEEGLSDSQTKLYTSSEDFEANPSSEIDWVLNLDQTKNEEIESARKVLPSVQEEDKYEESIKTETGEYVDDFEEPSKESVSGDIEGRTSLDSNKKKEYTKNISIDILDKLTRNEIKNLAQQILDEETQKQAEEQARNKLVQQYEKKRQQELNKQADKITEEILSELLNELNTNLFPLRDNPMPGPRKKHIIGIQTTLEYVDKYIEEVFNIIKRDPGKFIQALSQPLNRDSVSVLGQIQSEDVDYFSNVTVPVTQPVLPVETYLELEKSRKICAISEETQGPQHEAMLMEWSNIHNKCIFDSINDALDNYRPYGIHGPPLAWSKQTRVLTFRNGTVESIKEIFTVVKNKVLAWAAVNAGALNLNDTNGEPVEKLKLEQFREERLEAVLSVEVNDGENAWVDYEQEETQAILDTADMILENLVSEFVAFIAQAEHG